jgi:2'-5' RNA ligase
LRKIEIAYTEFTLWLTPCEPLRSTLRSIIRRLAASLDAVEFEPHMTVHSGPSTDAEARAVAHMIARQFSPIEVTADRLCHTERYTKTLFVQFQESAAVRQIFEAAAAGYSRQSSYVLNPHLSLLYKTLPQTERRELCEALDVPMGDYKFDRIRMIETELPIEDAGPVRRWRVVCDEAIGRPQQTNV